MLNVVYQKQEGGVNLWTNSCISIYVRLQLSDGILCLASTNNTMRILVVHAYYEATATFVAKGDDIANDATATVLWIGLATTIVGNVATFAVLNSMRSSDSRICWSCCMVNLSIIVVVFALDTFICNQDYFS